MHNQVVNAKGLEILLLFSLDSAYYTKGTGIALIVVRFTSLFAGGLATINTGYNTMVCL